MFQESMDDLNDHLTRAEQQKTEWSAVGDIIIENLQEEIDKTKVDKPCPCRATSLYWLLMTIMVLYRTVKVLKKILVVRASTKIWTQLYQPWGNCKFTVPPTLVTSLFYISWLSENDQTVR